MPKELQNSSLVSSYDHLYTMNDKSHTISDLVVCGASTCVLECDMNPPKQT